MPDVLFFILNILHYTLPLLSVFIIIFAFLPLLKFNPGVIGKTIFTDGSYQNLINNENLLGSDADCDINVPCACDKHAVISFSNGNIFIRCLKGRKVMVNGVRINKEARISKYDTINVADCEFSVAKSKKIKGALSNGFFTVLAFMCLFAFEFLLLVWFSITYLKSSPITVLGFLAFLVLQMIYFGVSGIRNSNMEIVICWLLSIGFTVTASIGTSAIIKQLVCIITGFFGAFVLYKVLASKKAVAILKIPAIIAALVLFGVNVMLGVVYNGSQNWVEVFSLTFQPSEFIKIILVFLSVASVDALAKKRNLVGFAAFTIVCICVLVYISDFGTAIIYLAAFITVLLLRQNDLKLFFIIGGIAVVVLAVVCISIPYVKSRIFSFGHAWENVWGSGYQQTRAMIAAASGGLFGVGSGNGFLREITAFDTDIVFGLICEELGLVTAICCATAFALLAFCAVKYISFTSPFYSIPVCVTAVIFITQAALNIFGCMDMLPFTGVTLPFISNGGSSLITCLTLTAFIKAAERSVLKIK